MGFSSSGTRKLCRHQGCPNVRLFAVAGGSKRREFCGGMHNNGGQAQVGLSSLGGHTGPRNNRNRVAGERSRLFPLVPVTLIPGVQAVDEAPVPTEDNSPLSGSADVAVKTEPEVLQAFAIGRRGSLEEVR